MRTAQYLDAWKKLQVKKRSTRLDKVTIAGVSGLEAAIVEFSCPVTALCGGNGVGKSAFIRATFAAVCSNSAAIPLSLKDRIAGADVTVELHIRNTQYEAKLKDGEKIVAIPDDIKGKVQYFDAAVDVVRLQQRFFNIKDITTIINGVGYSSFDERDISILRYIMNKTYKSIEIYEVDSLFEEPDAPYFDDDDDENIFPYFRVQDGEKEYDIYSMSFGEISAFLLLWRIRRLRKDGIFFMEEPETYISQTSQEALLDVLVHSSVEQNITFIFTTHSPRMISGLPRDGIKLLSEAAGGSRFLNELPKEAALRTLGMVETKQAMVFVEDRAARVLLRALILSEDRMLEDAIEICDLSGYANIVSVLKAIPADRISWRFIGIFDGDMRNAKLDTGGCGWKTSFLPMDKSIEDTFKLYAEGNVEKIAQDLRLHPEQIIDALARTRGLDPHDWLEEFPNLIGQPYEMFIARMVSLWSEDSSVGDRVREFVRELADWVRSRTS